MPTGLWLGNLKEIDLFEDIDSNWKVILKWIFKEQYGEEGGLD
jgi:hypothetical protein